MPDITAPQPLNRSKLVRLVNAAGQLLLKNGFPWTRLDDAILLRKACERTGLEDFGDDSFHEALRVLLRAYETEADLTFVGRLCVQGDSVRLLANRLRLVADRRRHPAIADEVIRRPLFITGLPRSGTTFLHALLAQDPAHRSPQVWEVMYPSPPPEQSSYDSDPRIASTARQLKLIDFLMPDFKTVHLIDARLPQVRRAPQSRGHDHDHPGVPEAPVPEAPVPEDWPEAPCGYLQLSTACDQEAHQARLRGWPVATPQQADLAQGLHKLIVTL